MVTFTWSSKHIYDVGLERVWKLKNLLNMLVEPAGRKEVTIPKYMDIRRAPHGVGDE